MSAFTAPSATVQLLREMAREQLEFAWPLRNDRDRDVRAAALANISQALGVLRGLAPLPPPPRVPRDEALTIRPGRGAL